MSIGAYAVNIGAYVPAKVGKSGGGALEAKSKGIRGFTSSISFQVFRVPKGNSAPKAHEKATNNVNCA